MPELTIQQAVAAAIEHHRNGRLADAEAIYRQILLHQPNNTDALNLLGVLASQVGQQEAAADLMGRAVQLNPKVADYRCNLGLVLMHLKQFQQAAEQLQEAVRLRPDFAEAYYNLGNALRLLNRRQEAVASYRNAVQHNPHHAWAINNMAQALLELKQNEAAREAMEQAIRIAPAEADFHCNLGSALWAMGQLDEAAAAFGEALRLRPVAPEFHSNLANVLKDQGNVPEAIEAFKRAIELSPDNPQLHSNLTYMLHFHPQVTPEWLAREHKAWNDRHAAPLKPRMIPHTNNRDPDRRLRIGYVSPDFREHAVGRFLLPLLEHHDHERYEVFCYSITHAEDLLTARMRAAADQWRDILHLTDDEAADLIRRDQIDILIDLSSHSANTRLPIFARKPAPVQVTYLAYPSTTGMEAMDYRLTDPYLDPPGQEAGYYSERSIHLPRTYWCYQPGAATPEVGPLPALTRGHVTFGCFNQFRKVTDETLQTWCELLREVPGSRLVLSANHGRHRDRVREMVQARGIDPDRIEFYAYAAIEDYFREYLRIDIGLDPFPYTGGTTTCDALWMGVPVVTLAGRLAVFRGGVTLLSNVGLPELIAGDRDQYLSIARSLAMNLPRLSALRQTLRERMKASPLMDAAQFARDVESAYRQMWRAWC